MWFSGGIASCIAFVALRGGLAHLSKVMEARQEHVSAERTASGVFLVFFVLKPMSTERICSGIGERVAPEYVRSERNAPELGGWNRSVFLARYHLTAMAVP